MMRTESEVRKQIALWRCENPNDYDPDDFILNNAVADVLTLWIECAPEARRDFEKELSHMTQDYRSWGDSYADVVAAGESYAAIWLHLNVG